VTSRKEISSFYYIGWLGRQNLGDEALYQIFEKLTAPCNIRCPKSLLEIAYQYSKKNQKSVNKSSYSSRINHPLRKPSNFYSTIRKKLFSFAKNSILDDPMFLYAVKNASAGFLGGGTLIYGSFYLRVLKSLMEEGLPLFSFDTGVQNPDFWGRYNKTKLDEEKEWDFLLTNFQRVLVRGVITQSLLADKGIASTVIGDPVLTFARNDIFPLQGSKIIGLNIGSCKNILWGNSEEKVFQVIEKSVMKLVNYGWKIQLFCVHKEDLGITIDFRDRLGDAVTGVVCEYQDPKKYIDSVESCAVFLGLKLHSVVIPFCRGVPSIMMEYRPKCRDFMKTVKAEEQCLRCDKMTPQQLIDQVYFLYENGERIQKKQLSISNKFKAKIFNEMAIVLSDINEFSN
jgi:hypothetical protein